MSAQSPAKERLQKWRNGIKIAHNSHLRAASYFTTRGRMLSVPVVIFTTIVGTAVFTSIASNGTSSIVLQVLAGFLSIAAAVLSSLNASLNYGELAERHRSAAVKYGNLRREIEQLLCFIDTKTDLDATMKDLRTRWDAVDLEAPEIPQKINDAVRADVHREYQQEQQDQKA
jgi:hypothetical protein